MQKRDHFSLFACNTRLLLWSLLILFSMPISSQTYTIDPSDWTEPPSQNITYGSVTLHGGLIQVKAQIIGSSLTFYIIKNDDSVFQNPITVFIRQNTATGTTLDSDDYGGGGGSLGDRDPLFEEIARLVVQSDTASTSSLQRRYNIGYNRAGRIMDQLEAAGIVGPASGGKPRKVLMDPMDIDQLLGN